MKTKRLYYDDSYLRHFTAQVVESTKVKGRPAVILDRTAFYPTSGGQPHDRGLINGIPVINVIERKDGTVVHVLEEPLPGEVTTVEGEIDWERRFDHMQQHTGQHILSQACLQRLKAETVGFHLGADYATIDLNKAPLSEKKLEAAEALANAVVFANRPVVARFVSKEELAAMPLRKPPAVEGPIRIVTVEGFDWSPCGGTHVRATGEVGVIKIVRYERRGAETRLTFLCGERAWRDYHQKNRLLRRLATRFSVAVMELDQAVEFLAEEAQATRKALKAAQERLLDYEAAQLWSEAEQQGKIHLIRRVYQERDLEEVRRLAQRLIERPNTVVLLATGGKKTGFVFARSSDLACDMREVLRQACAVVKGGGGGQPHFAQGGGPAVSPEQLEAALEQAVEAL